MKTLGFNCSIDVIDCNPDKIKSAAIIQDYAIQIC